MENVLKTNNLSKAFHGKYAVNNVNMTVQKGDIYGFIGKNGAGKTTLMRMVAGLAAATSGSFELFEDTIPGRQRIRTGCVIEHPSIYPGMTAKENLEVYRRLIGIPDKKSVDEILHIVGLLDTGKKKAKNFSMGMKQRLGIGIALLGNPDFLILDEPINGLDPTGIIEIRDLLLMLNQEQNITILISSHILGELYKIATCYGIINEGILVEEFSKQELESRCRRCLKIQVDQVKKAVNILETFIGIRNYEVLTQNTIRIFDHLDEAGAINSELSGHGVVVESLAIVGQDLEEYFMERMGGKSND